MNDVFLVTILQRFRHFENILGSLRFLEASDSSQLFVQLPLRRKSTRTKQLISQATQEVGSL
jgi:hypothetical protein